VLLEKRARQELAALALLLTYPALQKGGAWRQGGGSWSAAGSRLAPGGLTTAYGAACRAAWRLGCSDPGERPPWASTSRKANRRRLLWSQSRSVIGRQPVVPVGTTPSDGLGAIARRGIPHAVIMVWVPRADRLRRMTVAGYEHSSRRWCGGEIRCCGTAFRRCTNRRHSPAIWTTETSLYRALRF
jgi:hypothetical protein